MDRRLSSYLGCLLGLAVGDAMGAPVDSKSLAQIREDYGPDGILGYDLANGYAEISSHTQIASYVCNGLLLGVTRGQMTGTMAPFVGYIALAERNWAGLQRYRREPGEKIHCWVARNECMKARRCMDTLMLDTLHRNKNGTMEEPVNSFQAPGSIAAVVPIGLFFDPEKTDRAEKLSKYIQE